MAHAVEVYVTIENLGTDADRLVGASTVLHPAGCLPGDGESPRMAPSWCARFPAGGDRRAARASPSSPAALRIVLNDVQRPLQAGGHFDMTLTFEGAGSVGIEV